jgi:hypothetical protein
VERRRGEERRGEERRGEERGRMREDLWDARTVLDKWGCNKG